LCDGLGQLIFERVPEEWCVEKWCDDAAASQQRGAVVMVFCCDNHGSSLLLLPFSYQQGGNKREGEIQIQATPNRLLQRKINTI
jgi:hypothetical protein